MNIYKINDNIIASYSRGKLKRINAKRGSLNLNELSLIVPTNEKELDKTYFFEETPASKDEFFNKAKKQWFEFYYKNVGLNYRFTAKDGKALKEIGKYLTQVSGTTGDAVILWQTMLQHWYLLDDFYKKNKDLTFINSQLNKILNQLKNGNNASQTGKSTTADDLRGSFK